jgi:hypothetical protein
MAIDLNNITKQNLLADNGYHFEILNLPQFSLFSQTFELPGINLGVAVRPTPLKDIDEPGDKITFSDLTVTFLVDEQLENYKEIWKWIVYLGYPRSTEEYRNLIRGNSPYTRKSDMTMNVLTNKFNISNQVKFLDCWPYSLSGIQFNSANTEIEHPVATASFNYSVYYFEGDETFGA